MMKIVRARENDAEALAELSRRTFVETFAKDNSEQDMAQHLAKSYSKSIQLNEILDPSRRIEIAWIENSAAGFLHLRDGKPDASIQGPRPIELLRLYVAAQWHGEGIGASLMKRSIEIAKAEGFQTMWLGVWEKNFKAQEFYKKFGFEAVGKHVFRLGNDDQTDFIMTRAI